MEIAGGNKSAILRIIFAASFASLSYELALMRIFSVSLWYHFAFMIMSIAMLALSAGYQFVQLMGAATYLLAHWLIRQGPDGSGEPRRKSGSARTSDDEAKVTV
jgi:hypothetical protein